VDGRADTPLNALLFWALYAGLAVGSFRLGLALRRRGGPTVWWIFVFFVACDAVALRMFPPGQQESIDSAMFIICGTGGYLAALLPGARPVIAFARWLERLQE